MTLTPEKEALFVEVLKTQFLFLTGAALGACMTGSTDGLFEALKSMQVEMHPKFKEMMAVVEAKRAADKAKAEELMKQEPKKPSGPSPWGFE